MARIQVSTPSLPAGAASGDVPTWGGSGWSTVKPTNYYKRPTNALAETWPRHSTSQSTAITSGTIQMNAIELMAGTVVSSFNYRVGATGATGPTNQWAILTDSSRVMVAASADATSTVIAANTSPSYAVATIAAGGAASYTVPTTGLYYVGLMIAVSTTMPNIVNAATAGAGAAIAPILCGTSSSGQTAVPAFAFTAGAITAASPYVYIWIT